jgi:predicted protein tyrosine phosphatase
MNIRVSSLLLAPRLAQGWAQQVISLVDPDISHADIPTAAMLGVTENNHHTEYLYDCDRQSTPGAPSYAPVVRITNFARQDTRILVHCHAGMSRSPSIAIGLLIARGIPAQAAMRLVFAQNLYDHEGSYMEPNELLLRHLDRRLGQGGSLVATCRTEMMR